MPSVLFGCRHAATGPEERHEGLAWALSLPWEAFDDLNHTTNAEFLDLVTDDATIEREAREQGIPVFARASGVSVAELASDVGRRLGLDTVRSETP